MRVAVPGAPQATWEAKAGTWARRLARAGKALGGGLDVQGVEATKHSTERAHRCGVLGRKHSPGTGHEKGKRGVARG
jgi:hypothetical protein